MISSAVGRRFLYHDLHSWFWQPSMRYDNWCTLQLVPVLSLAILIDKTDALSFVVIEPREVHENIQVCPFDYTDVAVSGKVGP